MVKPSSDQPGLPFAEGPPPLPASVEPERALPLGHAVIGGLEVELIHVARPGTAPPVRESTPDSWRPGREQEWRMTEQQRAAGKSGVLAEARANLRNGTRNPSDGA